MKSLNLIESALMVVDLQCGFTSLCPNELPVSGGLEIVDNVNRLLALDWRRIDASQDWHPSKHCSFHGQTDDLYPPHCVAGTRGAEFVPGLKSERFHAIWHKGFRRSHEAYSVTDQHPGIIALYQSEEISTVVVCGLATNICCYHTACDFRNAGFRVLLVEDASAGIDVPEAELFQDKAKEEGQAMGIEYVECESVLESVVNRS